MNIKKIFQYIKENLDSRLKTPYVSQDYTPDAKEKLYAGMHIALLNANKKLTEELIIDVFNAMKPEKRANMKFLTRKGAVAFLTESSNLSEQGLLELLEWSEKYQRGYGPRFDLIHKNNSLDHFKTVKEMRDYLGHQSNDAVAKRLFANIKSGKYRLRYIPPFDSINPHIDSVTLTVDEEYELERMEANLAQYKVIDAVQPLFQSLIAEFNTIQSPSLIDIASFIKSMILLHPFPDGNGRSFTLGILNQVLLKNKLGICLNLDPRIALFSNAEIALTIKANLISLEQFELEQAKQQDAVSQESYQEAVHSFSDAHVMSPKPIELEQAKQQEAVSQESHQEAVQGIHEKKVSNLLTLSKSYLLYLREAILARVDQMERGLGNKLLNADPNQYSHDPMFKLTLQKYQAVARFCSILEGDGYAIDKLVSFKQDFIKNKSLLATRRDSQAITFLKGVLTLITVGVAALLGIWNVKGQKFGENIEAEVSKPVLAY